MPNFKNRFAILVIMLLLLTVGTGTIPLTAAHGNIRGKLVYTADVPSVGATELMFTITLGSNSDTGRVHIAGSNVSSTTYPRTTNNGLIILCHAFPDTDGDGVIDQNTTSPVIGVLKTDGTDLTPLTVQGEGAAYAASFSPDERHIAFSYADTDTDGDGVLSIQDTAHLAIKELGQIDPLNPLPRQMASNSRIRVLTRNADFSVEKPSFLSNDSIVFTGKNPIDGRTTVYLYNISNEVLTPLAPVGAQTRNPAVSDDGRQIAVEVSTLTESYDAVYDVEARTWSRLPSTSVADKSFAWSVNGTMAIAMTDGLMWQLNILDGTGLHKLVEIPQKISGLDFSPDGRMIAYLWDFDGRPGNILAVATVDGGYNASVTSLDSDVKDYDWIPGY